MGAAVNHRLRIFLRKIRQSGSISVPRGLFLWICCFLAGMCSLKVQAAVVEGKPGDTLTGEYAVIINTSMSNRESTGTLEFDASGARTSGTVSSAQSAAVDVAQLSASASGRAVYQTGAAVSYQIGQEQTIPLYGNVYVCIGVGDHCFVWMEKSLKTEYDAAKRTNVIASDMISVYEGQPYRVLNTLCGGQFPAQDSSGKLSILLEKLSGASGIYKGEAGITAIHIDTPSPSSYTPGEMSSRNGLLVHEGQHALLHLMTHFSGNGSYMWLNEGLAVAAMDYLWGGTDTSGWLNKIAGDVSVRNGFSLVYNSYRNSTVQDYSMPYLFVRYLIDRMAGEYDPMEIMPRFYQVNASNMHSTAYLENITKIPFRELLADFYTAVIAQERSGKYGFNGDSVALARIRDYPLYMGTSGQAHTLEPTAAIVIRLKDGVFKVPQNGGADICYRVVGSNAGSTAPSKGKGTAENPYEIATVQDLNMIYSRPDAQYRLTADIHTNGKLNFTVDTFRGVLDGNGHKISGLTKPLIAQNNGTIRDLTVEAEFTDDAFNTQGVLAQYNSGSILDCIVSGNVTIRMNAKGGYILPTFGGLVGQNYVAGRIIGCGSTVNIDVTMSALDSYAGGIAGVNNGTIQKCYRTGTMIVRQPNGSSYKVYLGGIAGKIEKYGMGGRLEECAHYGTLTVKGGKAICGQFCGLAADNIVTSPTGINGSIVNCYGRENGVPAVGSPSDKGTGENSALLTEEEAQDSGSYKNWSFGGEWKFSNNGPVRIESTDITSISVGNDTPKSCYVGERPGNWGYLDVSFTNGGKAKVKITEDMVRSFDSSKPGVTTITFAYKGQSTSSQFTVYAPASVDSIWVSSKPKNSYKAGEYFNPSGMSLTASIKANGVSTYRTIYSGFDYDKKRPLTIEDTYVIFSYYGATVKYDISVTGIKPSSVAVISPMDKREYTEGSTLSLSGLKLQITWNDGTKSPSFGPDEFEKYGITVAKGLGDSVSRISKTELLKQTDNGASILLCATDKLPGSSGAVYANAGKLTVRERMRMPDAEIHMAVKKDNVPQWGYSDYVQGGSGSYRTQVLYEKLPAGVRRERMPVSDGTDTISYFYYTGCPTSAVGAYESRYKIVDLQTGEELSVKVTIYVHASNEAKFYQFDLLRAQNPNLTEDVKGIIGQNTVVLRLPRGTDVTSLSPMTDYGSNMGASVPVGFWNGSRHDFTQPVIYEVTAPDGVTKVLYTVSVEFYDPKPSDDTGSGGTGGGSGSNPGGSGTGGNTGSGTGSNPGGSGTGGSTGGGSGSNPGGSGTGSNPGGSGTGGNTGSGSGNNPGGSGTGGSTGDGTGSNPGGSGTGDNTGGTTSSDAGSGLVDANGGGGAAAIPAGTRFTYKGLSYEVTDGVKQTARVTGIAAKKKKKVTIPSAAVYQGVSFRVTEIAAKAFRKNKRITTVTIGKNVEKIGTRAFENCKKLKKLTILSKKLKTKRVGSNAFRGCNRNMTVRIPRKKYKTYRKLLISRGLSGKCRYVRYK